MSVTTIVGAIIQLNTSGHVLRVGMFCGLVFNNLWVVSCINIAQLTVSVLLYSCNIMYWCK